VQSLVRLSQVLTLLAIALFLALGLDPVVRFLQRRGLSRGWSVAVVFAGVIALFAALVGLLLPPLASQITALANNAPSYVTSLLRNPTVRSLNEHYHVVDKLQEQVKERLSSGALLSSAFGGVLGAGRAAVSGAFSAFTVLVLTLYLTASLPSVKEACYRAVPLSRRDRVRNVGVLGLIPMVGATLGAVVVVMVALFSSFTTALIAAAYYIVYQQVENYLVAPRVMKRTIAVPGAVTVIAALAGATLLGVIGALMAIPTAAGLILLYHEVLVPRQQQH